MNDTKEHHMPTLEWNDAGLKAYRKRRPDGHRPAFAVNRGAFRPLRMDVGGDLKVGKAAITEGRKAVPRMVVADLCMAHHERCRVAAEVAKGVEHVRAMGGEEVRGAIWPMGGLDGAHRRVDDHRWKVGCLGRGA